MTFIQPPKNIKWRHPSLPPRHPPPSQNMEQYVAQATTQLPTLIGISLLLGLGKGGVPGLATVATAATVLTAPPDVVGGLGEDVISWLVWFLYVS